MKRVRLSIARAAVGDYLWRKESGKWCEYGELLAIERRGPGYVVTFGNWRGSAPTDRISAPAGGATIFYKEVS